MKLLQKVDGTFSKMNLVNALVFLLGVAEIVKPYIPEHFIPLIIMGVAVVNLYLRTTSTGTLVNK